MEEQIYNIPADQLRSKVLELKKLMSKQYQPFCFFQQATKFQIREKLPIGKSEIQTVITLSLYLTIFYLIL